MTGENEEILLTVIIIPKQGVSIALLLVHTYTTITRHQKVLPDVLSSVTGDGGAEVKNGPVKKDFKKQYSFQTIKDV